MRIKIIDTGGTLSAHVRTLALELVDSSILDVVLGLGYLGVRVTWLLGLQFGLLEGVHAFDLVDSLSSRDQTPEDSVITAIQRGERIQSNDKLGAYLPF